MTEATVDGGTSTGFTTFASQFPQPTREQWQELVAGVLRKSRVIGADDAPENPEELLATTTYDGVKLAPLYTADDASPDPGVPGLPAYVRGARATGSAIDGWDVRQSHGDPDADRTAAAVLADLENGVSSVFLYTGPDALDPAELPRVLAGVLLDLAPVALDPGADFAPAADTLLGVFRDRGVPADQVLGNLGADPVTTHARTGTAPAPGADLAAAADLAVRVHAEFPGLQVIAVDGQPYHEAGASEAQELGAATAAGVAYLRALTAAGLDVDTALGLVEFRFAATANQFLTIAKLRAARRVWARVAQASGAAASGAQKQHAVTSWSMATRRDPWVNMLRTTVAAFAAGVGGADAVTVRPFDAALGLPDAFARRIARNTQALLLEESHLAQVIDPAGGSWYVEKLTDELAHAAWAFFQDIERAGGITAALDSGLVADRVGEVREARARALATRTDPITGVSEFPHLTEEAVVREPYPARAGGGLPRVRHAEAYEALRDRSDDILLATDARPTVFLATLGPVAQHTARAQFARNLFAAGGIDAVEAGATENDDEVVEAYRAAGQPPVACLASSDKLYEGRAKQTVARLHAAGAHHVFLAGAPKKWAETNADGYVYVGCDALDVLNQAYTIISGADR